MNMKVSRKMQIHVEAKIRHAIATGPLPFVERSSTAAAQPRQVLDKANGNDTSHSK